MKVFYSSKDLHQELLALYSFLEGISSGLMWKLYRLTISEELESSCGEAVQPLARVRYYDKIV